MELEAHKLTIKGIDEQLKQIEAVKLITTRNKTHLSNIKDKLKLVEQTMTEITESIIQIQK